MTLQPRWMTESGPEADVVVSSRCRIARNLADYPFPWRATPLQSQQAAREILDAAHRTGGILSQTEPIARAELSHEDLVELLERRLVSPDWAAAGPDRWLIAAPDRVSSVMVNEEDHLRLQAVLPGLQVESVYAAARDMDEALAEHLRFARRPELGFLTASLANTGSGLRVSALLHLIGLAASDARAGALAAATEIGCAVRGVYGEGTRGTGELFQLSYTCTFGLTPAQVLARVASAARYLIEAERRARREQFGSSEGRRQLADAAERAIRSLFAEEAGPRTLLPLASILRLAAAERVLEADTAETAEWIALAGVHAGGRHDASTTDERYEAARRTAALRSRLRPIASRFLGQEM